MVKMEMVKKPVCRLRWSVKLRHKADRQDRQTGLCSTSTLRLAQMMVVASRIDKKVAHRSLPHSLSGSEKKQRAVNAQLSFTCKSLPRQRERVASYLVQASI